MALHTHLDDDNNHHINHHLASLDIENDDEEGYAADDDGISSPLNQQHNIGSMLPLQSSYPSSPYAPTPPLTTTAATPPPLTASNHHQQQPSQKTNLPLLSACYLSALTTGATTYAFSFYSAALKSSLHLTQNQLDTLSSATFCAGILSWMPGMVVDAWGARHAMGLGGMSNCLCLSLYWMVATGRWDLQVNHSGGDGLLIAVLSFLGVCIFMGCALVTGSVFKVIVESCGSGTKGKAVGCAKGYVGVGSGVYVCLFGAFFGGSGGGGSGGAPVDVDVAGAGSPKALSFFKWIASFNNSYSNNSFEGAATLPSTMTTDTTNYSFRKFLLASISYSNQLLMNPDSQTTATTNDNDSEGLNSLNFLLMAAALSFIAATLPALLLLPKKQQQQTRMIRDGTRSIHFRVIYAGLVLMGMWVVGVSLLELHEEEQEQQQQQREAGGGGGATDLDPGTLNKTTFLLLEDEDSGYYSHQHHQNNDDLFFSIDDEQHTTTTSLSRTVFNAVARRILQSSSSSTTTPVHHWGSVFFLLLLWWGPALSLLVIPPRKEECSIGGSVSGSDVDELSLVQHHHLQEDGDELSSFNYDDDNDNNDGTNTSNNDEDEEITFLQDEHIIVPTTTTTNNGRLSLSSTKNDERNNRNHSSNNLDSSERNFTLLEMLRTCSAWLMAWTCVIVVGGGTVMTNNIGQMTEALGFDPGMTSASLALFSAAQGASRVMTGIASEVALGWNLPLWLCRRTGGGGGGVPRPAFLVLASLVSAVAHFTLAVSVSEEGFAFGVTLSGVAFGMVWPMMVLITGEVYGTRHVGANYMFFDGFSSAAGTLLLSKFVAQEVYDEHIAESIDGDAAAAGAAMDEGNFKCLGTECFRMSHMIVSLLSLTCIVSSIALIRSTRDVYR